MRSGRCLWKSFTLRSPVTPQLGISISPYRFTSDGSPLPGVNRSGPLQGSTCLTPRQASHDFDG